MNIHLFISLVHLLKINKFGKKDVQLNVYIYLLYNLES